MADEDDSQKTEDPTPRKLAKAKEKGQVGSSQEIKNWVILLGGVVIVAGLTPWMMGGVMRMGVGFIDHPHAIPIDFGAVDPLFARIALDMLLYLTPAFGGLFVLALVSSIFQTGLLVAPSKIKPDWNKISPMAGLKRMFSVRSVVEFLKGIFKLSVVTLVAYGMAIPFMGDVALMPDYSPRDLLNKIHIVAIAIAGGAVAVMTVIAVLDLIYQKYEFHKSMKMSRQEVKDEYKQTEGDPQIKARIRKLRAERAQQRMMSKVPEADVVITNPTHYAVALSYKMENMQAPILVAKGVDSLAFRIREMAEEHDVPIVENPPLARALYAAVELDEEIPVEHYQAVAEVIGYVMQMKEGKTRGGGYFPN